MRTKMHFLAFFAMFISLGANAEDYDAEIDGIFYDLNQDARVATVVYGMNNCRPAYGSFAVGHYTGDVVIPESVEHDNITYTVTAISGGSEDMRYGAFEGSSGLTSITIPKTIKSIGTWAFSGCTSLNAVYISDLAAWCGISFYIRDNEYHRLRHSTNPLYYAHNLYLNGEKISDLTIPDNVKGILSGAFIGGNFNSVSFGKNVSIIGDSSFAECSELTDVYCYSPRILIYISAPAFENVESKTLHLRERYKDDYVYEDNLMKSKDRIMQWQEFGKIEYIEGIDFNLTYFIDGEEYKKEIAEVGESITPADYPARREDFEFSGWSGIPEIMPANDIVINGYYIRTALVVDGIKYKFEDNNTAYIVSCNTDGDILIVGSFTFEDKEYSVTSISPNSFKDHTSITSVTIPEGLIAIGDYAFSGCSRLIAINMPSTITSIGERAFAGIDNLSDVTISTEEVPATDRTAFENSYIEDYVTLHVPASAIEKYNAAAPWKNFKEIVAIVGTEDIEDNTEKDEIKIGDIGKTTYCSEYDLDFTNVEGIKAYTATGYDNKSKTIWLTRVMTVPAGTGILVKGDAGTYKVPRSTEDAYYTNMFKGNTGDPIKIEETEGDMTNYYLSGKDGSFVSVNGSANIGKNKAYLQLPTKFFAGTRSIGVTYDDEGTTGIWAIEQGTLNDERDVWFNLQGQRVEKPRKGLYIRNGKKVVVR